MNEAFKVIYVSNKYTNNLWKIKKTLRCKSKPRELV